MSLSVHGNATSVVEVTNISSHGIWLLAYDHELFMPYEEFPWFKDQPVKVIMNVEEPSPRKGDATLPEKGTLPFIQQIKGTESLTKRVSID